MLNVAEGHKVTVQVIEDQIIGFEAGQPAATVEWLGEFGNISALAQIGLSRPDLVGAAIYDFGAGAKYKSGPVTAHVDYGYKVAEIGNTDRSWHRLALHGQYDTGEFVPFLKFTLFDDLTDGADDNGIDASSDDNLIEFAVGSHWRVSGDVFRPYAAVHYQTGEWAAEANEENPAEINVQVGVMSQF